MCVYEQRYRPSEKRQTLLRRRRRRQQEPLLQARVRFRPAGEEKKKKEEEPVCARCGPNKCVFGLSRVSAGVSLFFLLRRYGWMDFNGWTVGWKGSPTLRCRYLPLIGTPSRAAWCVCVCVLCVVSRPSRRFVVSCRVVSCGAWLYQPEVYKKISVVAVCRVPVARSALSRSGARAGLKLVRPSDATLQSVQFGAFTCVGRTHTKTIFVRVFIGKNVALALSHGTLDLSFFLFLFFSLLSDSFPESGVREREREGEIGC